MKIKTGFILRSVGGNRMVVATGARSKAFGGMIRLNESGSVLWNTLTKGATSEELVEALLGEYAVDRETAETDVSAFLGTLREAGVLDE